MAHQDIQTILSLLFGNRPFFDGETHGRLTSAAHNLLLTRLVAQLGRRQRSLRVVEIGSWLGFTALTWAHAIAANAPQGGEVVCVDAWAPYFAPSDVGNAAIPVYGKMDQIARSGLAYALFCHNTRCTPAGVAIRPARGRSCEVLADMADGSADIVYVDGSHYYPDVAGDIGQARRILAEGGILCGDDLNLQLGEVARAQVLADLAADTAVDPGSGRSYHPGVTLAVADNFGPVIERSKLWAVRKDGAAYRPIDPQDGVAAIPPHFPAEYRAEAERAMASGRTTGATSADTPLPGCG